MAIRRREFQKLVSLVKDFLAKLPSGETTAELRDSLHLSLLHMHRYYKRVRLRAHTSTAVALEQSLTLGGSFNGTLSPVSPHPLEAEKFDWRWVSLDAGKLCASFGHGDFTNFVPEIFYILKDANIAQLETMFAEDANYMHETDALGRSTAMYAAHGGTEQHLLCLRFLVEKGVDLNHQANDGTTCLHVAVHSGNLECVAEILKHKIDVNAKDYKGHTALHWACMHPEPDVVQLLLDSGASYSLTDNEGMNPLMWACYFDQLESLEVLLSETQARSESSDQSAVLKDVNGKSLIHWAVSRPMNKDCVKFLLTEDSAKLMEKDGKSVFMIAAENGCVQGCEDILTLLGNKVMEETDRLGRTALHLACISGHGQVVDLLLNRGASQYVKDMRNLTPLDYIQSRQLSYCSLVFLSYRAYNDKLHHKTGDHHKAESLFDAQGRLDPNNREPSNHNRDLDQDPVEKVLPAELLRADVDDIDGFEIQRDDIDDSRPSDQRRNSSTLKTAVESRRREGESERTTGDKRDMNDVHSEGEGGVDSNAVIGAELDLSFNAQRNSREEIDAKAGESPRLEEAVIDFPGSPVYEEKPSIDLWDEQMPDETDKRPDNLPGSNAGLAVVEPIDLEFEDDMLVLVEHHGSDDEQVVFHHGQDLLTDEGTPDLLHVETAATDGEPRLRYDLDHDLLDISHTPRLPTMTPTATSERSAAVVSVTGNLSVASLGSDTEEDEDHKGASKLPRGPNDTFTEVDYRHRSSEQLQDIVDTRTPLDEVRPLSADSFRTSSPERKQLKGTKSLTAKNRAEKKISQIPVLASKDGSSSPNLSSPRDRTSPLPHSSLSLTSRAGSLGPLEPIRPLHPLPHNVSLEVQTNMRTHLEVDASTSELSKNKMERRNSPGQSENLIPGRRDSAGSNIPRPVSPYSQRRSLTGNNVTHMPKPPSGK